jgi:hypothetical protein
MTFMWVCVLHHACMYVYSPYNTCALTSRHKLWLCSSISWENVITIYFRNACMWHPHTYTLYLCIYTFYLCLCLSYKMYICYCRKIVKGKNLIKYVSLTHAAMWYISCVYMHTCIPAYIHGYIHTFACIHTRMHTFMHTFKAQSTKKDWDDKMHVWNKSCTYMYG